jgi:SAM-dependent methyltransferase
MNPAISAPADSAGETYHEASFHTARVTGYARRAGVAVEAVGFDVSGGQLEIVRKAARNVNSGRLNEQTTPEFLIHDLADPLPWPDRHFHLVLCNYAVLNHLPKDAVSGAIAELCRVATFRVVVTLRALAGPPTGCIVGLEELRDYREDCRLGRLVLQLKDGSEHALTFNLYSADTLKRLFARHASIVDIRAVDLFVSRFAPDARWTGILVDELPGRQEVVHWLKEIEEPLCRLRGWIDHGTHVLIVAEPEMNGAST